jgi:hypothetical protein
VDIRKQKSQFSKMSPETCFNNFLHDIYKNYVKTSLVNMGLALKSTVDPTVKVSSAQKVYFLL